jgi:hypothetical protein
MPIVKDAQIIDGQEVTIYIELEEIPPVSSSYDDLRQGPAGVDKVIEAARDGSASYCGTGDTRT